MAEPRGSFEPFRALRGGSGVRPPPLVVPPRPVYARSFPGGGTFLTTVPPPGRWAPPPRRWPLSALDANEDEVGLFRFRPRYDDGLTELDAVDAGAERLERDPRRPHEFTAWIGREAWPRVAPVCEWIEWAEWTVVGTM